MPGPSVSLQWSAPDACIDARTVEQRVEQRLGHVVFAQPTPATTAIDARIERGATGWTAVVTATYGEGRDDGRREIAQPGDDCRALDASLVLVISLLVDPDRALAAAPLVVPPAPSPPPPIAQPPGRWALELDARGLVAAELVGGASLGARVGISIEPPWFPAVVVSGTTWINRRVDVDAGAADLGLMTVGIAVCPTLWRRDALSITACVGGQAGQITATGVSFDVNRRQSEVVGYVTAEAELGVAVTSWMRVEAGAGVWTAVSDTRFFYEAAGIEVDIYEASWGSLVVGLGAVIAF